MCDNALVRDKRAVLMVIGLLLLAGLVFLLKWQLAPRLGPEKEAAPNPLANNPIKKKLAEQRTLFKPLTPLTVPITQPAAKEKPVLSPKTGSISSNAKQGVPYKTNVSRLSSSKTIRQSTQQKQTGTQFVKIGFNGRTLPDSALKWSCARDIDTGLLWEIKLFDAGVSDVEHRYSWYDPTKTVSGFKNNGECYGIECDTDAYTREINRIGLCDSTLWRVPTFSELETLLDRQYAHPVINQAVFYNTRSASYWSKTQLSYNPNMVMQIDFFDGTSSPAPIRFKLALRLVSL